MTEQTEEEVRELRHFADLMLSEPCELYALHMRHLAESIDYATRQEIVKEDRK